MIRIENGSPNVTGQLLGRGTKLFIDEKEIPDVTDIHLHFDVDRVVKAEIGVQVSDSFVFQGNVDVYMQVQLQEGDILEHQGEGRYVVTRKS